MEAGIADHVSPNSARHTLIAEYLSKQARTVASEQQRIQKKIQDGSRLTKHRFTV
jgi:hypothetical protein